MILRTLAEASITTAEGETIPITASLGVATFQQGDTLESLVDRADRAMYASKTAGRNRCTLAPRPSNERVVALRPALAS